MLSHFLEEKNFRSTPVESVKSTGRRSHHDPLARHHDLDDLGYPPFSCENATDQFTNSPGHVGADLGTSINSIRVGCSKYTKAKGQ